MADIRINALATTAASTASDDFLAVDGSSQGTRKLNAYSPTFGGNLTVSGTGTFGGAATSQGATGGFQVTRRDTNANAYILYSAAGNISIFNNSVGADFLTGDKTTNAASFAGSLSTAGNLTVSGTGTSSFGGKIQSSAATATGYNQLYDTTGITTGRGAFGITSTGAGLALGIEASVGGTSFTGSTAYSSYFGTTTATPIHFVTNAAISATLTSGGNLLIGTTTDSANGKLQLATHTTSAGGIGFGTDVSLYRQDANTLVVQPTGSSKKVLFYGDSTVSGLFNSLSSYEAIYFDPSTHSIKLATNGFTALTLDTSQNATFAGKVGIGVSPSSWELNLQQSATNSAVRIISPTALGLNDSSIYIAWASGSKALIAASYESTGSYRPLVLSAGGVDSLTLDTSGNSTFAGGIIGMTQGNVDNISDDGVASFTPLYNRGFIVINNPDYNQNALIAYFKAGSSYLLYSITKSADVTLNNSTTLTGTTGTDGKLNIGYNNSIIYIENRLGGIANFQRYALGGTN